MIRTPNATTDLTSTAWDSTTNTPSIHATTNISITSSATGTFSAAFTAPNTTNACTGVWIFMAVRPAVSDLICTLQEASVDTTCTITIPNANLPAAGTWLYIRFPTPYVFTAITAGRYRFKLRTPTVSTTSMCAADGPGTAFAYIATDNRTGILGATDDLFIGGHNGLTTPIEISVVGTSNVVGSGTDTQTLASGATRSVGMGVMLAKNGTLKWDTTASATLQLKGSLLVNTGNLYMNGGTVGTPYPTGQLARLQFNQNGVSANFGLRYDAGSKVDIIGVPKSSTTLWKSKYTSGTGTAIDPLITASAVDWSVGDEIIISAASNSATNYSETESRFIITKNSATSYVVSSTKGGAEAALTYAHSTDAWILNVERNVIIDTTNTAQAWYLINQGLVASDVVMEWVRMETVGNSASSKEGIRFIHTTSVTGTMNYCVCYRPLYRGYYLVTSKAPNTFTGLISCMQNSASNVSTIEIGSSANNKTLIDCFSVGNNRGGIAVGAGANYTLTRCYAIGTNSINSASNAGISLTTPAAVTLNDCEIHCVRNQPLWLNGATGATIKNLLCGTKGANQVLTSDVVCGLDTYNDVLLENCMFTATTLMSGYAGMIPGSEVRFHKYQQTENRHRWYTPFGMSRTTGAALTDTTVRTPGSLGLSIMPEDNADGFTWAFNIPSKANSITSFFGWFQLNALFTGDAAASARVELYLPGSTTPDTSYTLLKTTNGWQAAVLSATNTSSTDGLAEVRVVALTATVGAYVYADDLYNAGDTITSSDKVTGLDTWYQGKPISIIQPSATSAADIWNFPTSGLTTSGTTGKQVKDLLTVGKFLGLK